MLLDLRRGSAAPPPPAAAVFGLDPEEGADRALLLLLATDASDPARGRPAGRPAARPGFGDLLCSCFFDQRFSRCKKVFFAGVPESRGEQRKAEERVEQRREQSRAESSGRVSRCKKVFFEGAPGCGAEREVLERC